MQVLLKALSWTFLHSLWQGLLAAVLAAIIISATKKATASLRYNLLGVVILLFLVTTVITFQVQLNEQERVVSTGISIASNDNSLLSPTDAITYTPASQSLVNTLSNWFNRNAGLLMLAWAILFLLNCLKLFTGLATVRRLRHYKTYPVTTEWENTLIQLQARLAIRRSVELLQSGLVKVPVVLGVLRPVILVPVGLLANIPAEQAEAILLHELSHIRRKDYLVNLLQRFADAVFFFNPAFTWVSSLLRQEREACCDDMVVAHTGQKRNYVDALVSFQEYSLNMSPAMAIGGKRQYLLSRVKRILTNENKRLTVFETLLLFSGFILFCAFTVISKKQNETAVPASIQLTRIPTIDAAAIMDPHKMNTKPVAQPAKKEKSLPGKIYKHVADTIPVKKDSVSLLKEKETKREDANEKAKQALNDIEKIKEKIGQQKEAIGIDKEKLNNGENQKETQERIAKKREILERDRAELDKKRSEWENYKKQAEEKKKTPDQVELKAKQISILKEQMEYSPAMTPKEKEELKQKIKNNIDRKETEGIKPEEKTPRIGQSRKTSYQPRTKIDQPRTDRYKPRTEIYQPGADGYKPRTDIYQPGAGYKPEAPAPKKESPAKLSDTPTLQSKLLTLKSEVKLQDHQYKLDHEWDITSQSERKLDNTTHPSSPTKPKQKEGPSPPASKKETPKTKEVQ